MDMLVRPHLEGHLWPLVTSTGEKWEIFRVLCPEMKTSQRRTAEVGKRWEAHQLPMFEELWHRRGTNNHPHQEVMEPTGRETDFREIKECYWAVSSKTSNALSPGDLSSLSLRNSRLHLLTTQ